MVGRAALRADGKMNGHFAIMATSDRQYAFTLYTQNFIEI